MSLGHHVTQAERTTNLPPAATLEEQSRLSELQRKIHEIDVVMRDVDVTRDEETYRRLRDERQSAQNEYDDLRPKRRWSPEMHEKKLFDMAAEADQLVLAQNAPFTQQAPVASGGESAVPDGVTESSALEPLVVTPPVIHGAPRPERTAPSGPQ